MATAEFQCSPCKRKYRTQPERDEKNRTRKGCFDIYPSPILAYRPTHVMKHYSRINYFRCTAYFYNAAAADWINYLTRYKDGHMPFAGSLMEQPAKFVEAMELVDNLNLEHLKIIEDKAKKYGK